MLTEAMHELAQLHLGPMATRLSQWVDDPGNSGKSHTECVLALAQALHQARAQQRVTCFLRRVGAAPGISIAGVHTGGARGLTAQVLGNLSTCDWVRRGHSLVVTGPTRSGKTYLALALAQETNLAKLRTEYWRIPELLLRCAELMPKERMKFMQALARLHLLVLDDFATEVASAEESHWLRQILDGRERSQKATLIASPNAIEDWDALFQDATAADAIVGRVSEASHRIELKPMKRGARKAD